MSKNHPASKRRLFITLLLVTLIIVFAVYHLKHGRVQVSVAFIERNFPDSDLVQIQRADLFEELHRYTLQQLINEFNQTDSHFHINLIPADPKPTPSEAKDYGSYLSRRYKNLAKRGDLVAVFDNSWGKDISLIRDELQKFPVPIVFLNADRNNNNYGVHRFFVGSSDGIPTEIVTLAETLLKSNGSETKSNFVFFTESEYPLKDAFYQAFSKAGERPAMIMGSDYQATNPAGLNQVETSIMSNLLHDNAHASEPKLIILNGHWRWGNALIPWLDSQFRNLTVIAYESLFSRSVSISFGNAHNELIVLSDSSQTTPESLFLRHRALLNTYPKVFNRPDAVFYMRRCVIAMEMCKSALNRVEAATNAVLSIQAYWPKFWNYEGYGIQTQIGIFHFDSNGILLGQNRFLQPKNGTLTSYLRQLSYQSDNGLVPTVVMLTNVSVGIRNLHIRSVNIESGSFGMDFDYWLREPASVSDPSKPPLDPIDFKINENAALVTVTPGQRLLATKVVGDTRWRVFHVAGTFEMPLDGNSYPFDAYRLKLNLQAVMADDRMRLSQEALQDLPKADGWVIKDSYVTLNSRETSPVPISLDSKGGESSQFDAISVIVKVYRKLWNPFLLIVFPLALLVLASIAVLFIKFVDDSLTGGGPSCEDSEGRKLQTELSLGCMLAVITYLISYATLAPRLEKATYADMLVGFTLLVSVSNFVFVVAISARNSNWFFRFLSLNRYRILMSFIAVTGFVLWTVYGLVVRTISSAG